MRVNDRRRFYANFSPAHSVSTTDVVSTHTSVLHTERRKSECTYRLELQLAIIGRILWRLMHVGAPIHRDAKVVRAGCPTHSSLAVANHPLVLISSNADT